MAEIEDPAGVASVVKVLRAERSKQYRLPPEMCGLGADDCEDAADLIERQAAEIARLRTERDGIRADQQRAIAENLSLGNQVWGRALQFASLIAADMRADPRLVRALKDYATPTADKEG